MNKGYPIILTGYIGWGLFPLYWLLLAHVPALEVLLHRMLWAVPFLIVLVVLSDWRKSQVLAAFHSPREIWYLSCSSILICFNWGIYIWAVFNQQVVEASMGYFLTPLLNVVAGVLVFGERLNRLKAIAIGLAAAGVLYYISTASAIPWTGLAVGLSFAAYGLLRKKMETNAVPGLLIETLLLLPMTLGLILWLHYSDRALFINDVWTTDLWLILGGVVTVVPLAFFTAGARMLPMTSVGILFYITPTIQFILGVFLLGEAFNLDKLIGFVGIWAGLAVFTYSLLSGNAKAQAEVA